MHKGARGAFVITSLLFTVIATGVASRDDSPMGRNRASMKNLGWAFGPGWSLYSCLVVRTVGLSVPMEGSCLQDERFPEALSEWQRKHQLDATGVMNQATISAMKNYWQSRRAKGLGLGAEKDFVKVPVELTAQKDERELGRKTYQAFTSLREAALGDRVSPRLLTVISGYRSPKRQAELRKKNPSANSNQIARNSAHSMGRAVDLDVGGELVSTANSNRAIQVANPAYRWLLNHGEKYGFVPYFFEPWHWEYVGN